MRGLPRPQHATVVAYLALFVALGGVSYAAIKLPANSVGSKQIKKSAVTSSKINKRAVTTSKIKSGAVTSGLVKDGSLQAADFAQLPAGPQGPQGEAGTAGPPGPTFGDAGLDTGCCATPTPTGAAGVTGSKTVTLPVAGRLFVFGSLRALIENCTDNCSVQYGLRIDGVAVSGSLRKLSTIPGAPTPTPNVGGLLTPWGITATLAAGAHTIELVKEPTVGTMLSNGFGDQQIGAIELG
jgi:hypothetical protein